MNGRDLGHKDEPVCGSKGRAGEGVDRVIVVLWYVTIWGAS